MESHETNNPQPETPVIDGNSELNQNKKTTTNNGETPESQLEKLADITGKKESENGVISPDSSTTSSDLDKNDSKIIKQETSEPIGFIDGFIDKVKSMIPVMSPPNEKIYDDLLEAHDCLVDIYRQKPSTDIKYIIEDIDKALNLMKRLFSDIDRYRKEIESSYNERNYLQHQLAQARLERNNLDHIRQNAEADYRQQIQNLRYDLSQKIAASSSKVQQMSDSLAQLTQEKESSDRIIAELEASKGKLLAEVASLKRNTGTHYEGTSDRPQHHVLTGEYKNLKEQYLDPLADSLFKFLAVSNPELKQQRKEKVNDIKANISAIVLIGGQAMMRGESTGSIELPSGMLTKMQNLLYQELQLANTNLLPQVSELLTKAANLTQGKVQYPIPGKWQENDFKQAVNELSDRLCQKLQLNLIFISQDIQTEIQKAINKALNFLQRANLANPPALLSLDRYDYHEAAKGYDDEGKVIKTIYPVYLVNSEPKVKAIIITEPLTQTAQPASGSSPVSTTNETLSFSLSASNPSGTVTKSLQINEDEKEKIRLQGELQGRRESLINGVRYRLIDPSYNPNSSENERLLTKLSQITSLEIIQKIEKEVYQPYPMLTTFTQKVNELIP